MSWTDAVFQWVLAHPDWALGLLFAASAVEGLFIIGMFVPGVMMLFGVGALIALGAVGFWPAVACAGVGAVIGDTVTYLIGRRYGDAAFRSRFAARYPEAIARSREFFARHGGKSIIFGRYAGPLRSVVPAVAGACGMSLWLFLLVDAFTGAAWSLTFIVPGVVFGASLSLAAEVATRLAVLLLALAALVWLMVWLVRIAVRTLSGRAEAWVSRLLDWSRHHRRIGRLGAWLADPDQPETPGLAILALALLGLSYVWLLAWWGTAAHLHPNPLDALTYQGLRDLRTPWGTAIAITLAQLGDWPVYLPVAGAALAVLLWLRQPRAAAHWVAAVAFGATLALGLYLLLHLPDPQRYFRGERSVRFAGRDLVLATVIYGWVPVMLSVAQPQARRVTLYSVAACLLGLIAAAQFYLGEQWLSVGLFSILIGVVWVALLGFGYRQRRPEPLAASKFLAPVLAVFVATAVVHGSHDFHARRAALAQPVTLRTMDLAIWWRSGYATLPAYRSDLAGLPRQPLNVQWAGSLEAIAGALSQDGWHKPLPLNGANSLRWLATAPIDELPILPQVHEGRHQALIVRKSISDDRQWVLRLWPSGWQVGDQPLWAGTLSEQHAARMFRIFRAPRTGTDFNRPLAALDPDFQRVPGGGFRARQALHPDRIPSQTAEWDGRVWLLRPSADMGEASQKALSNPWIVIPAQAGQIRRERIWTRRRRPRRGARHGRRAYIQRLQGTGPRLSPGRQMPQGPP